jgi:hypothetical protein
VTTFATGYHARRATVIAFGPCEKGEEVVGSVQVNGFNWNCDGATPEQAATRLGEKVGSWLTRGCGRGVLEVE